MWKCDNDYENDGFTEENQSIATLAHYRIITLTH
jgi:hypothetical protein